MTDLSLRKNFLTEAHGFSILDTATVTWTFDTASNELTADVSVAAGSIADDAITNAKLANMAQATIKGRAAGAGTGDPVDLTASQARTILSISNVEDTSLSTWAGSTSLTTLGTIGTGTWNATAIADGKIASALTGKTYNGLTLTAAAVGFTIAGGTTSKTLTVPLDATVSGTNTGDQSGANPSASVGLSAVNGSTGTFMRSDGAPALSVAIAPTWTGLHTFSYASTGASDPTIKISTNIPVIAISDADGATNAKNWDFLFGANTLSGRAVNDAFSGSLTWLQVTRSASTSITDITLGGPVTVSGALSASNFNGFADPSASIGLAAVNGTAITAMRSDGAPALSQAIAPTWTDKHIFSKSGVGTNAAVVLSTSSNPFIGINQSGAAANNRMWDIGADSGTLLFRLVNDAISVATAWLTITRSGTTISQILFGSPPRVPNYTVANLPSASTSGAGALAFVTDATQTAILGLGLAPTGSGSNKVMVYSDGTSWLII